MINPLTRPWPGVGVLVLILAAAASRGAAPATQPTTSTAPRHRDLTFIQVSDTHYGLSPVGDQTVPLLVDKMNALPGTPYPPEIGGTVGKPRGVILTGDITNDGRKIPWDMFVRDYGLDGTDGRLKYPIYETFGNHDGGTPMAPRNGIRERNKRRVGITNISENGLHYSFDWDGIHFVSCGISVGTVIHPYDPEHSFEFLRDDLKKYVGDSGRPVIIYHHFGFDKGHSLGWWPEEWRTNYYALIKDYNVIGILQGHAHESFFMKWNGIDIYHPPHFRQKDPKTGGPVSHGFFVYHITDDEMTVAERKLDDTWGLTSRKSLKAGAVP